MARAIIGQRRVVSVTTIANTPPGSPINGQIHILGAAPTGAWSSFAPWSIVTWDGISGVWRNTSLDNLDGWPVFDFATGKQWFHNGTGLREVMFVGAIAAAGGITFAGSPRLLARFSSGGGASEEATIGAGLEFNPGTAGQLWIADKGVTNAKLRDSFGSSVVGRPLASLGPPSDIIAGVANGVLRDNGSGLLAFALLVSANIAAGGVAGSNLRNSAALSVMGNPTNGAAAPVDVATGALSNGVLRESGSAIGWGLLGTANLQAAAGITRGQLAAGSARSVIGVAGNAAAVPADIPAGSGSNAVLRESAGVIGWGLVGTNNVASGAIGNAQLRAGLACSVVGNSTNGVASLADIQATADGQILARKAGSLQWLTPSQPTLYQKVYDGPALWGENPTVAPTLALTNPTLFNQTSGTNHFVGFLMGDTKLTWLHWGFALPADVAPGSNIVPRVCFVLNSAAAAGNVVELSIVSALFSDNDFSSAGSPIFGTTAIPVTGYGASDYVIVDLNPVVVGFTPGTYWSGVIQRDARAGNAPDTYADLIGVAWIAFRGSRLLAAADLPGRGAVLERPRKRAAGV